MINENLNVGLIGNGDFAVQGLKTCLAMSIRPIFIICDASDKGTDTWRKSFLKEAIQIGYKSGINLLIPDNPNDINTINFIRGFNPDLILSLQCRNILRNEFLKIPKIGVFNLHNAPLPLLRGCDPFAWAIEDGLTNMGTTIHRISDEGIDNGPIYAQKFWNISPRDNAWSLYQSALNNADDLLRIFFKNLIHPGFLEQNQSDTFSTYHSINQFDFKNLKIDWSKNKVALSAWIRARIFPPIQSPWFYANGERVFVLKCFASHLKGDVGNILSLDPIFIGVPGGSICIESALIRENKYSGPEIADALNLTVGTNLLL